ncbi:unnamed protein product [Paramecium primaurelia]|uniref:Uncharacterized protein n=1 Tax=Paramecium primaurelia TaxID=5886 RepID=A0A8S1QEP2_PARPR|nr:unnamed protein product [Paramecium primaurelia]
MTHCFFQQELMEQQEFGKLNMAKIQQHIYQFSVFILIIFMQLV